MGYGIGGGGGDSGLWNRSGHPGDTLAEMACLSGQNSHWDAPLLNATATASGAARGPSHTRWTTPTRPAVTLSWEWGTEPVEELRQE